MGPVQFRAGCRSAGLAAGTARRAHSGNGGIRYWLYRVPSEPPVSSATFLQFHQQPVAQRQAASLQGAVLAGQQVDSGGQLVPGGQLDAAWAGGTLVAVC